MFGIKKEAKRSLKKLSFYKTLIQKPCTWPLNNIDMLCELLFYDELNIVKRSQAFKGYACSYSDEIVDSRDPSVPLTISRPSIKDLSKDL